MKKRLVLLTTGLLASACTWVELADEAKEIRIVSMEHVKACKKLGKVVASVKNQIAGFDRSEKKVQSELETIARNTAIELKGDSIVAVSPIKKGRQTYAVYQCAQPEVKE